MTNLPFLFESDNCHVAAEASPLDQRASVSLGNSRHCRSENVEFRGS